MPTINLTAPQTRFRRLTCKYPAFIGGFGSGKTQTLLSCAFEDKLNEPKLNVALYTPTYDLADLILVPRITEILDQMKIRYMHNKSKRIMYLKNRGQFIFRSLDNPSRIVGYEVYRSHIDEIDILPLKQAEEAWIKIMARNRQQTATSPMNRISAYSTPEGFKFMYKKWGKDPKPSYQMVRAATASNPHLPEDYIPSLMETYPEHLIQAYLEGIFVNLTSGTVYVMFDRQLNHSDVVAESNEPLYIGMDFNVQRGCAVVHVLRDKLPVAVGEVINSYDTPDTIRAVKNMFPGHPITVYPDASGGGRRSVNATETDLSALKAAGFRVKAFNVNPNIKDRVSAMNAMFCNAEGTRRYKVNTHKCPFYTDALEQQIYDKNGLPEKGEGKWDDVNDGGGYYINYEFPIKSRKVFQTSLGGT